MVSKLLLLATALTRGTMAQTMSVMDLYLNTEEGDNATYHGSIISAAPEATTYSVAKLPENCTEESFWRGPCSDRGEVSELTRIYVNGPSTYARHLTEADAITWDAECNISGNNFDCEMTFQGPSAAQEGYETMVYVLETMSSLNQVTITAGLGKILAVTSTTVGTAQTAASASSGPSETGDSASATSASSSASTPSTTASGAATGPIWNIVLAAICGAAALALRL